MNFGQWVLGAVAAGLALGAVHAQAAPMPRTAVEAAVSAQPVQFYFLYDDPPLWQKVNQIRSELGLKALQRR